MQYHHHRPTAADRLCRPVRRHNPPPPAYDPGAFPFIVIGGTLAVCLVALAIAILSQ